jgi:hypothetical protein
LIDRLPGEARLIAGIEQSFTAGAAGPGDDQLNQAHADLDAGDLDGGFALMRQAVDASRAAGHVAREAGLTALSAEWLELRLDLLGAAREYAAAARETPADDPRTRWRYLSGEAQMLQFRAATFGEAQYFAEAALIYRDEALPLTDRAAHPQEWAQTEAQLGFTLERISERGDTQAARDAVAALTAAKQVITLSGDRDNWLEIENQLGNALTELAGHSSDEQAGRDAVAAYIELLAARRRDDDPRAWAINQDNLATVLSMLGARTGDGGRFREAVTAYRHSLEVFTRDADPRDWAMASSGLGAGLAMLGASHDVPIANRRAVLHEAVAVLRSVQQVYTLQATPQGWAGAQMSLANALGTLGEQGDDSALRDAVSAYQELLAAPGHDTAQDGRIQGLISSLQTELAKRSPAAAP